MELLSPETMSIKSNGSNRSDSSFLMSEQPKSAGSEAVDEINASKHRNVMMRSHFGDRIPADQCCIADFSCALVKNGLLRQGRLYVTVEYLAFHSFIAKTKEILPICNIKSITPKSIMLLPTGLIIEAYEEADSWELGSFLFRDNCLKTIETLRRAALKRVPSSSNTSAMLPSPVESDSNFAASVDNNSSSATLSSAQNQTTRKRVIKAGHTVETLVLPQMSKPQMSETTTLVLKICLAVICLVNVMLLTQAFTLIMRFE